MVNFEQALLVDEPAISNKLDNPTCGVPVFWFKMAANLERIQQQIQTEVEKFKGVQKGKYAIKLLNDVKKSFNAWKCYFLVVFYSDLQKSIVTRQQLDAQLAENNVVKEVLYVERFVYSHCLSHIFIYKDSNVVLLFD